MAENYDNNDLAPWVSGVWDTSYNLGIDTGLDNHPFYMSESVLRFYQHLSGRNNSYDLIKRKVN